jgi:hypothetical protein
MHVVLKLKVFVSLKKKNNITLFTRGGGVLKYKLKTGIITTFKVVCM